MMSSGLKGPIPAIPIPAFDVPNAAPTANNGFSESDGLYFATALLTAKYHLKERESVSILISRSAQRELTADDTPANPKKGAYAGQTDMVVEKEGRNERRRLRFDRGR